MGRRHPEARTAPSRRSLAWSIAIRTEATVGLARTNTSVMWSLVTMIPFDLTYLIAFQANSRAVASVSVGWRFVTTCQSAGLSFDHVLVLHEKSTDNACVFCFYFASILSIKWQDKDTQVFLFFGQNS